MIKYIKYLLVFLLATGFVACSEDEGAQILGGLYEKVDITPEPGMNLVGRVTDGTGPIEGVVVSDGVTVTTTDAQGIYQMRVKRNAPFVFVSVPAEYEIPVENGMPKIYKKIAMGDNDVVQRSFKLERTGKKKRFTLLALADVQIGRDDEVTMLDEEVLPLLIPLRAAGTGGPRLRHFAGRPGLGQHALPRGLQAAYPKDRRARFPGHRQPRSQ